MSAHLSEVQVKVIATELGHHSDVAGYGNVTAGNAQRDQASGAAGLLGYDGVVVTTQWHVPAREFPEASQ